MIHPTAIVSPRARIGNNVSVGPFTIVHDDVVLGDDTIVGSHCEIGHPTPLAAGLPLVVGASSLIRSHSVFYQGSTFGDGLVTGHRVTAREKIVAGACLQLGTLSDIQGHCEFRDHVRLHSNVHVGQGSRIGSYVWLFPYVVLTNDPHPPSELRRPVTLEDFVVVATMSVLLPGVTVRMGALVAAHSSVRRDVDADTVVGGNPAQFICETNKISLKDGSGQPAYPWRRHFHRGYPPNAVREWLAQYPLPVGDGPDRTDGGPA